jgi:uncharacterized protein
MIIDIHRHFVTRDWFSENFWKNNARMIHQIILRRGLPFSREDIQAKIFPRYFDTDGEKHLEQMEKSGIDKTVVFLFDTGLLTGEPKVHIEEQNKIIFQAAKKYSDKIIPFVHIDPRRRGAIKFVKKCVEEWGAKGLKLHPGAGFNPEEMATLKMIETISDYKIPVITHTGPSIVPTSSRYCDPIYLDKMLLSFPEVNFIAAHMAYGYRPQLCSLGWQRPNLYTDISVSQDMAKTDYPKFARTIREVVDAFGPERVLFGTDGPFTWGVLSEKDFVVAIKDLATKSPDDTKFTENEVAMILGDNAKKLLNI